MIIKGFFHPTAQLHIRHPEFPEDPTSSQGQPTTLPHVCIHLPWEHQHCNHCSMRKEWGGQGAVAVPSVRSWCGYEPLVGCTAPTVGCRSNTELWKELQSCQETVGAGQQHTEPTEYTQGGLRHQKIQLTKLIHMCSFPLCLNTLKQVINFLASAEHETASFQ